MQRKYHQQFKKATTNREYRAIIGDLLWPPYWDEGIKYINGLFGHERRMYKSWKHTRKTQWKP